VPSVVHTGELPKDLWIDWKEIPAGNRKSRSGSKETKNDPVSGLRPEGRGLHPCCLLQYIIGSLCLTESMLLSCCLL
jgi:hypothetical protein